MQHRMLTILDYNFVLLKFDVQRKFKNSAHQRTESFRCIFYNSDARKYSYVTCVEKCMDFSHIFERWCRSEKLKNASQNH